MPKEKNEALLKKYTPEETRRLIKSIAKMEYDPAHLLFKLGNETLPKYFRGTKKEEDDARKDMDKEATQLLMALGLENHYPVAEATGQRLRPLAIEFTNKIIEEYDCKAPSEIALAEVVTIAYTKLLSLSQKLHGCIEVGEFIRDERTRYLAMLSKELDRANRQFITAIATLRQIKNPTIEVNVKAKTAFIAQNQQINADNPPKSTNNETNER